MTDEQPYLPKEYIITYEQEYKTAVSDALQQYAPHAFTLVPCYSIRVESKDREQSLLELLAKTPGVTFREGVTRKVLDDRVKP